MTIDPIGTANSRVVSIGSTNWAGGRSATDHGHPLRPPQDRLDRRPAELGPSTERFQGNRAALDAAGPASEPALIHHDTFSVEAGLRHGHGLLSLATPPTAVVAGNDEIAIGVLATAKELGVGAGPRPRHLQLATALTVRDSTGPTPAT